MGRGGVNYARPTGPRTQNLNFSITSYSYFYFCYGLFGGRNEANRRGFIQIGPCKPLKRAPKDDFFLELRHVARRAFKIIALI